MSSPSQGLQTTCPTCGSPVTVKTSDEGTSHCVPALKLNQGIVKLRDWFKPVRGESYLVTDGPPPEPPKPAVKRRG